MFPRDLIHLVCIIYFSFWNNVEYDKACKSRFQIPRSQRFMPVCQLGIAACNLYAYTRAHIQIVRVMQTYVEVNTHIRMHMHNVHFTGTLCYIQSKRWMLEEDFTRFVSIVPFITFYEYSKYICTYFNQSLQSKR